jgi:hypothetical protein
MLLIKSSLLLCRNDVQKSAAGAVCLRLRRRPRQRQPWTALHGDRFTILKDRRKEIGPGLLQAMLDQLGLTRNDIKV